MSVCSTYPITRAKVCCSFGKPPTRMSPVMAPAARQCQCAPFNALPACIAPVAAGAERRALTRNCDPLLKGPQARRLSLAKHAQHTGHAAPDTCQNTPQLPWPAAHASWRHRPADPPQPQPARERGWAGVLVLRPAMTSMSVVLPAPDEPTSAVSTPGRNAPLHARSSCSIGRPSTATARGVFSSSCRQEHGGSGLGIRWGLGLVQVSGTSTDQPTLMCSARATACKHLPDSIAPWTHEERVSFNRARQPWYYNQSSKRTLCEGSRRALGSGT